MTIRMIAVGALFVPILAGCNCGTRGGAGDRACVASSDCASGEEICLPTGLCATTCSASNPCGAGQKCSLAGGCVAESSCGADGDCTGNKVCGAEAQCVASCAQAGCEPGLQCQLDGHCRAPGIGQTGGVGGTGGGLGAPGCGGQLFSARRVGSNFLILLDQSGSMLEPLGAVSKWQIASDAVRGLTTSVTTDLRYGLALFPGTSECEKGSVRVGVADNTAPAIASALGTAAPNGRTPLAFSLKAMETVAELRDPERGNYVLLVTDGRETCYGEPIGAVEDLARLGIKTFVVGFGGEVDPQALSEMARYGGTARATEPRYYQADDAASLQKALADAAKGALGCDFKVDALPPDPSKVFVYVNGQLAPRDPSGVNGWGYDPATGRVTLYGPTCAAVSSGGTTSVQMVYGCPDDKVIEGGPGTGGGPGGGDNGGAGGRDAGSGDNGGAGTRDGGYDAGVIN